MDRAITPHRSARGPEQALPAPALSGLDYFFLTAFAAARAIGLPSNWAPFPTEILPDSTSWRIASRR